MSVAPGEGVAEAPPPTDAFQPQGDAAFGALMDALAPEPDDAGTPPAEGSADGGKDGAGAAPGTAASEASGGKSGAPAGGAASGATDAPAAGEAASTATPGADGAAAGNAQQSAATGGGGDLPEGWTAAAADLIPKFGELSTKLEERTEGAYKQQALAEVKEEHKNYFTALDKHPRLLVGQQVPAIGKEGMETIRSTEDARDWQEAVKSILVSEVNERATRAAEEGKDFLTTVHASIELFQNNADLVPGTKDFDKELADRFAEMAQPYELRVDGKLQGYSVPVQPIISSLRTALTAERAAKPASPSAPPSPSGGGAPAATPAANEDPPQAGIPAKAGSGSNSEDFSTLFGTIGLPNLQI